MPRYASREKTGLTGVQLAASSIADVDGDGNQDLLITGRDANSNKTATLYLGEGQGVLARRALAWAASVWVPPQLGTSTGTRTRISWLPGSLRPLARSPASCMRTSSTTRSRWSWRAWRLPPMESGSASPDRPRRRRETPGLRSNAKKGSLAGSKWTSSSRRPPAAPQPKAKSYRFVDSGLSCEADRLTYRLRQVDTDGAAHLSRAVTVDRGGRRSSCWVRTRTRPM